MVVPTLPSPRLVDGTLVRPHKKNLKIVTRFVTTNHQHSASEHGLTFLTVDAAAGWGRQGTSAADLQQEATHAWAMVLRDAATYWATAERQAVYTNLHLLLRRLHVPQAAEEVAELSDLLSKWCPTEGTVTLLTRSSQVCWLPMMCDTCQCSPQHSLAGHRRRRSPRAQYQPVAAPVGAFKTSGPCCMRCTAMAARPNSRGSPSAAAILTSTQSSGCWTDCAARTWW